MNEIEELREITARFSSFEAAYQEAVDEARENFLKNFPETLRIRTREAAYKGKSECFFAIQDSSDSDAFVKSLVSICEERGFRVELEHNFKRTWIYVFWGKEEREEPTINFTAHQINNAGAWQQFTDWSGIDYYTKLDRFGDDETFKIPLSKAKDWRLI